MDQLKAAKFWLTGPSWLAHHLDVHNIPKHSLDDELEQIIRSDQTIHSLVCLNAIQLNFKILQHSEFDTILNIMSYVLRFIYNCRNLDNKLTGPFSLHELQQAEL